MTYFSDILARRRGRRAWLTELALEEARDRRDRQGLVVIAAVVIVFVILNHWAGGAS